MKFSLTAASAALLFIASAAFAADYPAPKQGDWIAGDFRFHTGETVQELPPVVASRRSGPCERMPDDLAVARW